MCPLCPSLSFRYSVFSPDSLYHNHEHNDDEKPKKNNTKTDAHAPLIKSKYQKWFTSHQIYRRIFFSLRFPFSFFSFLFSFVFAWHTSSSSTVRIQDNQYFIGLIKIKTSDDAHSSEPKMCADGLRWLAGCLRMCVCGCFIAPEYGSEYIKR